MDSAVSQAPSPFHIGERQVQERLGVRDRLEAIGQQMIRDHLLDQHRDFYAGLPFVLLGSVDGAGRPWASLVPGRPGFVETPDAYTLDIAARPLFGDPLGEALSVGAEIGFLGIEPATRRRNRLTGRIVGVGEVGFSIAVKQSFGNCPQYIQTRDIELLDAIDAPQAERPVGKSSAFDDRTRALIAAADTFFIATAHESSGDAVSSGADVSHRGGRPGFVRVEDERTFVFPDFSGNRFFNTIGNIIANPKAGFLFVDFETRDLVYLTGSAEIVWDGEEVEAFTGAERLIRFHLDEAVRVEGSLPMKVTFGEFSPVLDGTGDWAHTAQAINAGAERNTYVNYEIFDTKRESDVITSFYLRRADGRPLASHEPGQFLPIRLKVPGADAPATRTYTLSDAPGSDAYRLSIKREGGDALVSNHFHDHLKVGAKVQAMAPRGKFALDPSGERPVVLISGGVGVTPMIAMANHLVKQGRRTIFVHGAQNGSAHAFGDHVRNLAAGHPSFTAHVRYSRPAPTDRLGETHDSEGHVDADLLKSLLQLDDYDFYLCGPGPFMQALYDGLNELGVREDRIHYESFGPATLLKRPAAARRASGTEEAVEVRFDTFDMTTEWTPDAGTLLDLAEQAGLNPLYSCRSGICGTCATKLKCGAVDYIEEPTGPHEDGEVLICCATPRATAGEGSCGEDVGVVLEL